MIFTCMRVRAFVRVRVCMVGTVLNVRFGVSFIIGFWELSYIVNYVF